MGFIFNLLTLPVLGPSKLVHWLAETMTEEAEREYLDEGRVRGELLELQQLYDAGELEEEAYDRAEKVLLERLNTIRELKAQRSQGR